MKDEVAERILSIVADKTGYASDMLELDLDLARVYTSGGLALSRSCVRVASLACVLRAEVPQGPAAPVVRAKRHPRVAATPNGGDTRQRSAQG